MCRTPSLQVPDFDDIQIVIFFLVHFHHPETFWQVLASQGSLLHFLHPLVCVHKTLLLQLVNTADLTEFFEYEPDLQLHLAVVCAFLIGTGFCLLLFG